MEKKKKITVAPIIELKEDARKVAFINAYFERRDVGALWSNAKKTKDDVLRYEILKLIVETANAAIKLMESGQLKN